MKTLLFIALQVSGTMKSEINSFLSTYAVPIIATVLIVSVGWGVAQNYDKIIDKDGQGTRKEALINLAWIVGYVVIGLVVISGVVALVSSKLKLSI